MEDEEVTVLSPASDNEPSCPSLDQSLETEDSESSSASVSTELSSLVPEGTITIKVGAGSNIRVFHLPAVRLKATSDFFARALKPEWIRPSTPTIDIPDFEPSLFTLYATWVVNGAEIMIDLYQWRMEHDEYVQWRDTTEHEEEAENEDEGADVGKNEKNKPSCPDAIWDFELTTQAWFLGEYLQSRDFQNHCMGHLYYMNHRFNHLFLDKEEEDYDSSISDDEYWHWGTIAYIKLDNVLHTWQMTEHRTNGDPFTLEQHPLRRFYVDWLKRYWDAYEISDWDYEAQDAIVEMIKLCPDLVYKHLRGCMALREIKNSVSLVPLGRYWVELNDYPEEVSQRVLKQTGTHTDE